MGYAVLIAPGLIKNKEKIQFIKGYAVLIAPDLIKIQFITGYAVLIAPGLIKIQFIMGYAVLIAPGLIKNKEKNTVYKGVCCFDSPWFNKKYSL